MARLTQSDSMPHLDRGDVSQHFLRVDETQRLTRTTLCATRGTC